MKHCPNCKKEVLKCLCFGLPMWLCTNCNVGGGVGSKLFRYSNGVLWTYIGSYWKALWK